jgi:hypothetical protein
MKTRLLLIALLSLLCIPSTAMAASSGSWYDTTGDSIYPAVDIKSAYLGYSDDDIVTIGFGTGYLVGGDRMDIFVDIDNNGYTGWYGADVAFYYEQYISGQGLYTAAWNGSSFQYVTPQTLVYSTTTNSVVLSIQRAELGAASNIRVFARGGHSNVVNAGSTYSDWAPNSGSYDLALSSVGGVSGGGDQPVTPTPTTPDPVQPDPPTQDPVAYLTLGEARKTTALGMRRKLGWSARTTVARSCTRLSSVRMRCAVTSRRGSYLGRGQTTVGEVVLDGVIRRRYTFSGKRWPITCGTRCASAVRWSGIQ